MTGPARSDTSQSIRVPLDNGERVSGLLLVPPDARACSVFAHGAGAGMTHAFMPALAQAQAVRRVASKR